MGSVYSFSLYRNALEGRYNINRVVSGLPYMASLFFYALSMLVSGRTLNPVNFKRFVMVGGGLFVAAWVVAALSSNIVVFILGYGLFMGWAVGMLYGAALSFIQWYARGRHGFLSGVMLLGFGLSSVVLAPVAQHILAQRSLTVLFFIYGGAAFSVFVPLMAWLPSHEATVVVQSKIKTPSVLLKTIIFFLATMVGLTIIGITGTMGIELYGFEPRQVALMISFFALCNALSRPIFGIFMDRWGFKVSAIISLVLMVLATVISGVNQGNHLFGFILGYGLYWFNLGAWLSIMPTYIKQSLGKEQYAQAYGKVFIGYGLAAMAGTFMAGVLLEWFSQTLYIYLLMGIMIVLMAFFVRVEIKAVKQH